jgi:hypothetical protein
MLCCAILPSRSYSKLTLLTSLMILGILKILANVSKSYNMKMKGYPKHNHKDASWKGSKLPFEWKNASELGLERITWRYRRVSASVREPIPDERPLHLNISRYHWIYGPKGWDSAPIVIPKYRLIFFTIPKVACTVFKQLFLRMMGDTNWRRWDVHDPAKNGLKYLHDYSIRKASYMLASDKWKKAIFVRDPMDRILSAYLDKALSKNASYIIHKCCPKKQKCGPIVQSSFTLFLHAVHLCPDSHWEPQIHRMEGRYWPLIDFVGHLETAAVNAKALLMELGSNVWENFGASGWGFNGSEPIFHSTGTVRHTTNAKSLRSQYYNQETLRIVKIMFAEDIRSSLFSSSRTIHA